MIRERRAKDKPDCSTSRATSSKRSGCLGTRIRHRVGKRTRSRTKTPSTIDSSGACVLPASQTRGEVDEEGAGRPRSVLRACVLDVSRSLAAPSYFTEPVTMSVLSGTPS